MKRALGFLGLAVVAFVAFVGYRIVTRSGMLKQIASHRQGECRVIEGIVGGEDVTIDREISHGEDGGQRVVIFDVGVNGLTLAETVTYPELRSPNDLVAVGPRQFYATNDRRYREPGLMATLEGYLALPLGTVSYFDGSAGRIVVDGLVFTNGINVSADARTVYVAEFLGQTIGIYDREPASGALQLRDTIPVHTSPDNIELDESGVLWIAAHPKVFDLLAHGGDPTKRAPSQVLRIDPKAKTVDEVLLDDGTLLSGSSTAAVAGDRMVVGSVFEAKILVCDRPKS